MEHEIIHRENGNVGRLRRDNWNLHRWCIVISWFSWACAVTFRSKKLPAPIVRALVSIQYIILYDDTQPFFRISGNAGKLNKFSFHSFAFYDTVCFMAYLLQVALCFIIHLDVFVMSQGFRKYSFLPTVLARDLFMHICTYISTDIHLHMALLSREINSIIMVNHSFSSWGIIFAEIYMSWETGRRISSKFSYLEITCDM